MTRTEQMAQMLEEGQTLTAIAKALGVSIPTVSRTLKAKGYSIRRGTRPAGQPLPDLDPEAVEAENDRIHQLRVLGLTLDQIGDVCGMDKSTVLRRLKASTAPDHGALTADAQGAPTDPHHNDDEDVTDKWAALTEEVTYWKAHARYFRSKCKQLTQ